MSIVTAYTTPTTCRNGIDNDGDGLIDKLEANPDPGCYSPADPTEEDCFTADEEPNDVQDAANPAHVYGGNCPALIIDGEVVGANSYDFFELQGTIERGEGISIKVMDSGADRVFYLFDQYEIFNLYLTGA